MPSLCDDAAQNLVTAFTFSGGEIDNIVRKATIMEVLDGRELDIQELKRLCRMEKMYWDSAKIRFSEEIVAY